MGDMLVDKQNTIPVRGDDEAFDELPQYDGDCADGAGFRNVVQMRVCSAFLNHRWRRLSYGVPAQVSPISS